MRNRRFVLASCCLLFLILPTVLHAQLPIDPSQSVNAATGEMQFNLPLGSVQGIGGSGFPLSLNCHAGIRLDETASPVGLGFSYGPGGITRKVVFVPDDNHGGTGYFAQDMSKFNNIDNDCKKPWWLVVAAIFLASVFVGLALAPLMDPISAFTVGWVASRVFGIGMPVVAAILFSASDYIAGGTHVPTYNKTGNGMGFLRGATDDLPDIYFVNTPFASGEILWVGPSDPDQGGHFVFKQSGGSTVKDASTIRIKYDMTKEAFEITLADGTRLIFDEVQRSPGSYSHYYWQDKPTKYVDCKADGYQQQTERVPASWLLSRVLYPDYVDGDGDQNPATNPTLDKGSWLSFQYDVVGPIFARPLPETRQSDGWSSTVAALGFHPDVANSCVLEEHYLHWVKTPNQSAEFMYSNGRLDDLWFRDTDMNWPSSQDRNGTPLAHRISSKSGIASPVSERRVLDSIVTRNKDGQVMQTVTFQKDYMLRPNSMHSFSKDQSGNFAALAGNGSAGCLTLKSVVVKDARGTAMPPTVFSYGKNAPGWSGQVGHPPQSDGGDMGFNIEQKDYWGYYVANSSNANDFNKDGDSVKAVDADNWSLTSVAFATGGSIRWEYEPQRYDAANGGPVQGAAIDATHRKLTKYGGGVRVKTIGVGDGLSHQYSLSYFYTNTKGAFVEGDGQSSGHATVEPFPYLESSDGDLRATGARGGLYTPAKVTYEMVQVVDNYQPNPNSALNGTAPKGSTVYEYVTSADHPNGGQYGEIDNSWKRGIPTAIAHYNSSGKLISETRSSYTFGDQTNRDIAPSTDILGPPYKNTYGAVMLASKEDANNGVVSKTDYKYAPDFSQSIDRVVDNRPQVSSAEPWLNAIPAMSPSNIPTKASFLITSKFGAVNTRDYVVAVSSFNAVYIALCVDAGDEIGKAGMGQWKGPTLWRPTTSMDNVDILGMSFWNLDNDAGGAADDLLIVLYNQSVGISCVKLCDFAPGSGSTLIYNTSKSQEDLIGNMSGTPGLVSCGISNLNGNSKPDILLYEGDKNIHGEGAAYPRLLYVVTDIDIHNYPSPVYTGKYVTAQRYNLRGESCRLVDSEGSGIADDLEITGPAYSSLTPNLYPVARTILHNISLDLPNLRVNVGSTENLPDMFSMSNPRPPRVYAGMERLPGNLQIFAIFTGGDADHLTIVERNTAPSISDLDGQPNQIIQTNPSTGRAIGTLVKPAYWVTPYATAMKAKNMLTPACQSVSYDLATPTSTFDNARVVSASATAWSQVGGNWLPQRTYSWRKNMTGAGLPTDSFTEYVFSTADDASNPDWSFTGQVESYTAYSQPIQTKSAAGIRSTTIYDKNSIFANAAITNAARSECIFTSWEDRATGDLVIGTGTAASIDVTTSHAGVNSLKLAKGTAGDPYVLTEDTPTPGMTAAKKVRWEFWAKADSVNAKSFTHLQAPDMTWYGDNAFTVGTTWQKFAFEVTVPAGKQYHVVLRAPVSSGHAAKTGTIWYDDVRAYPSDAMMTSYTYDPALGVPTSVTDANNNTSKSTYDGFGRVTAQYNTKGQKVKQFSYHLQNEPEPVYYQNFETGTTNFVVNFGSPIIAFQTGTDYGRSSSIDFVVSGTANNAQLNLPSGIFAGKKVTVTGSYKSDNGNTVGIGFWYTVGGTSSYEGVWPACSGTWQSFTLSHDFTGATPTNLYVLFYLSGKPSGNGTTVLIDEIKVVQN